MDANWTPLLLALISTLPALVKATLVGAAAIITAWAGLVWARRRRP